MIVRPLDKPLAATLRQVHPGHDRLAGARLVAQEKAQPRLREHVSVDGFVLVRVRLKGRVASTADLMRGTACCIHRPHKPVRARSGLPPRSLDDTSPASSWEGLRRDALGVAVVVYHEEFHGTVGRPVRIANGDERTRMPELATLGRQVHRHLSPSRGQLLSPGAGIGHLVVIILHPASDDSWQVHETGDGKRPLVV